MAGSESGDGGRPARRYDRVRIKVRSDQARIVITIRDPKADSPIEIALPWRAADRLSLQMMTLARECEEWESADLAAHVDRPPPEGSE